MRAYDGGWAEYATARQARLQDEEEPQKRPKSKPAAVTRPAQRQPDRLAELEARIQAQEVLLAQLEETLAEDWSDVDTIAAHRRARDELRTLLEDWEERVDEVVS